MQNEKPENPTRDNKNIKQGQVNEHRLDNENTANRNVKTDKTKYTQNESNLGRGGISSATGSLLPNQEGGRQTQKTGISTGDKQAGSQDFQGSRSAQSNGSRKGMGADGLNEKFDEDQDFGSQSGNEDEDEDLDTSVKFNPNRQKNQNKDLDNSRR